MTQVIDKFIDFYTDFSSGKTSKLAGVYADDVIFEDPAHRLEGIDALRTYFERNLENVDECVFDILHTQTSTERASVEWVMTFRHPHLNGGKVVKVDGVSMLSYQDKVVWHRDYYDMGQLLYEQVPFLGAVVRRLKKRVAGA